MKYFILAVFILTAIIDTCTGITDLLLSRSATGTASIQQADPACRNPDIFGDASQENHALDAALSPDGNGLL